MVRTGLTSEPGEMNPGEWTLSRRGAERQECEGGGLVGLPPVSTRTLTDRSQHLCFPDTPRLWAHSSLELRASSEQQSKAYMTFYPPEKATYFSTASEQRRPTPLTMLLGHHNFPVMVRDQVIWSKTCCTSQPPGMLGKIFSSWGVIP